MSALLVTKDRLACSCCDAPLQIARVSSVSEGLTPIWVVYCTLDSAGAAVAYGQDLTDIASKILDGSLEVTCGGGH